MDNKIDYDLLFSKKPFNNMDKQKLESIKQIHQKMQTSSTIDMFTQIQELRNVFTNESPLTLTEVNDIICVFKENMDNEEAKKLDTMVSMMIKFFSSDKTDSQ